MPSYLKDFLQNAPEHLGGLPYHDIHKTPPPRKPLPLSGMPDYPKGAARESSFWTLFLSRKRVTAGSRRSRRQSAETQPGTSALPPGKPWRPKSPRPAPRRRCPAGGTRRLHFHNSAWRHASFLSAPVYTKPPPLVPPIPQKNAAPKTGTARRYFFSCHSRRGFSSS